MERDTLTKFVLPAIIVVSVIISILILCGLASENPDGFEWTFFDFAGISEPEGGFEGIWSFLGEGPFVDVISGVLGIVIVLILGYLVFWFTSRKS